MMLQPTNTEDERPAQPHGSAPVPEVNDAPGDASSESSSTPQSSGSRLVALRSMVTLALGFAAMVILFYLLLWLVI